MFDSLFDLPLVIVGAAILFLFCAFVARGLGILQSPYPAALEARAGRVRFHQCHDAGGHGFLRIGCGLDRGERVGNIHGHAGATTSREATAIGVLYPGHGRLSRAAALGTPERTGRESPGRNQGSVAVGIAARCRVEGWSRRTMF